MIIGIVLFLVFLFVGYYCFDKGHNSHSDIVSNIMFAVGVLFILSSICSLVASPVIYSTQIKRDYVNERFGTNYTTKEIFFLGDMLDEVRMLERKGVEIIDGGQK
jgi:uncharacterized membrane protein YtjA (UPF0391 family)